MQVVILAGGLGKRIQSVSRDVPKSLLLVAGKPFIDHQLDLLAEHGFLDVLLCVGHLGEQIEAHLGDGSDRGCRIEYSWEDPSRLLGTGGAMLNAWDRLRESFLVMYGDSYLPTDYAAVAKAFSDREADALMCVFRNEGRWDPSNVRIEGDRVTYYSKSAAPGEVDYIDYGLSAYRKSVIEGYNDANLPFDMATLQEDLVKRGKMSAFVVTERFYEIGKPEGLAELETHLAHHA